jgi:rhodanese-related sulfurtransferase
MATKNPSGREFKTAAYTHLAEVGKALANNTRLEILDLLLQAPRTVELLAREVGQSVANTSHHLQALKRARLVQSQREGVRIIYSPSGPEVGGLLAQLDRVARVHVAELEALSRDFFGERDALDAIDAATLLERLRLDEAVLIDVRPTHEFEAGHLPGALGIPLDQLEERLSELPRDRMVVAYCRGPYCTFSADAVHRLREYGFDGRRSELSVASWSALGEEVEGVSP